MQIGNLSKHDLKVVEFASVDENRPSLNHIFVRVQDDNLQLIATDSYKLIIHNAQTFVSYSFKPFMMPALALQQVDKLVKAATSKYPQAEIQLFENCIKIPELGITIDFRQYEGTYPDVDKLIKGISRQTTGHVRLDPHHLQTITKFFRGGQVGNSFDVTINGHLQGVEFKTAQTYAILMPLIG
jgi:DNA polymerase III sliding clamp (beta) subunit (PCNA family)